MFNIKRIILCAGIIAGLTVAASAQNDRSQSTMRRGSRAEKNRQETPGVTQRMQQRMEQAPASDADLSWMRVIYRSLDLNKNENAPLYFPERPTEGEESLIRIIMRLVADGTVPAYEYLDGREVFTDQYKLNVKDVLDRFHIYYTQAKGSTEKNPRYTIDENDVPANEVLSYYIIERWEFDSRANKMRTRVQAICPVLHRSDDFGMESVKYPMFWIEYGDLRPYLTTQNIFVSDANNLPSCTYDDFFQLGLYDGEIYKTKNLRNRSMAQLYPEPEARKHAQDSIEKSLTNFDKSLWVPSLEELEARRAAAEKANTEASDTVSTETEKPAKLTRSRRGTTRAAADKKPAKTKRVKAKSTPKAKTKSSAARSVRNRKR